MSPIAFARLGQIALRHGFVLAILAVYLFFSIAAPTFFGLANLIDRYIQLFCHELKFIFFRAGDS